jgi:chromosome partitioning protein
LKRIAIINQKGGVGKTTTAANLSAALSRLGKRVAVIDLDPQANLTVHLGVEAPEGSPSIYHVLLEEKALGDVLRPTSDPNLRVAPSNLDLAGAEVELVSEIGRETRLREGIDAWIQRLPPEDAPDFIVIDCPPSLGLLSVNGLVAATDVHIAVQTEFFALRGLTKLLELVDLVKRRLNPSLEISGIIAGLYDGRRNLNREVLQELRDFFGDRVYKTVIRENVRLAEAPSHGQSIFDYAPDSFGAFDYMALAQELLALTVAPPLTESPTLTDSPPQAEAETAPEPPPEPARAPEAAPAAETNPAVAAPAASENG